MHGAHGSLVAAWTQELQTAAPLIQPDVDVDVDVGAWINCYVRIDQLENASMEWFS